MATQGFRGGVIAILVVIAAGAGLFMGRWIAERRVPHVEHGPATTWQIGDEFPPIRLVTEWGDSVWTDALLAGGGAVLFLDMDCPPCADMARKWDRAVKDGVVASERLVGITTESSVQISFFRRDHRVEIPIYRDPGAVFLQNRWIASFPLEVIVGRDGTVRSINEDATAPVDTSLLRAALGGAE